MPDTRITAHSPASAGLRVISASVAIAKSTPPMADFQAASSTAPGRRVPNDGAPARPVAVAVLAGDAFTHEAVVAHLSIHPGVRVLGAKRQREAEVVLILVDRITEDTLELMERVAEESATQDVRFVLVGDGLREHQLLRVVSRGLVSVIPPGEADLDRVLRAIADVHEGRLEMPGAAIGWIAEQLHTIHQDVLKPNGLSATGLKAREVSVLRLLAEGLSTGEIAEHLDYSERTVKNIIHDMLTRLNLRNRAHAVAFAVRSGAL